MNTQIEPADRPGFSPAGAPIGLLGLQLPERFIHNNSVAAGALNSA
jgi:hypothetical protein